MRLRAAAGAVALTALAACSSDPAPPSTLPSLSAAPSTSPSAAAVPSEAAAATPEGAAEFARFFYAQVTRGFQTQDSSLVSALSLPTCKTCSNYVRSIDSVRADKLTVEGGDFQLYLAVAPGQGQPSEARVDVGWDFTAVKYLNEAGEVVEEGPAVSRVEEQLDLVRIDGEWRVEAITRIRQG